MCESIKDAAKCMHEALLMDENSWASAGEKKARKLLIANCIAAKIVRNREMAEVNSCGKNCKTARRPSPIKGSMVPIYKRRKINGAIKNLYNNPCFIFITYHNYKE